MGALVGLLVVWALFSGGIGALIGNSKGKAAAGFWWGFFLGWIGWIIVAVSKPSIEHEAAHAIRVEQERSRLLGGPARQAQLRPAASTSLAAPARTAPKDPPIWAEDPFARFALRCWDSGRWTDRVCSADGGEASDPVTIDMLVAARDARERH